MSRFFWCALLFCQTLFSLSPVAAVLVDRSIQWVNNHEVFFLFPLRIIALLATAWSRHMQNSSSFSHFSRDRSTGLLSSRPAGCDAKGRAGFSSLPPRRRLRRWTEEAILCSALDAFSDAASPGNLLDGSKEDCARDETLERLYLATAAVLRVYRQILCAERNRRKSGKRSWSHQMLRTNILVADGVESLVADILPFLLSDVPEEDGEKADEEDKAGNLRGVGMLGPKENGADRDADMEDEELFELREQPLLPSLKEAAETRIGRTPPGRTARVLQQLKPRDERLKWDIVLLCLEILGEEARITKELSFVFWTLRRRAWLIHVEGLIGRRLSQMKGCRSQTAL